MSPECEPTVRPAFLPPDSERREVLSSLDIGKDALEPRKGYRIADARVETRASDPSGMSE